MVKYNLQVVSIFYGGDHLTLSNRIAEYRKHSGISRAEAAKYVGITRQSLGLIEAKKVIPSTLVALRLSQMFGVPMEELFFEEADFEETDLEVASVWPDDEIQSGDRVVLANIDGRKVARVATGIYTYPTQARTAVAESNPDKGKIRVKQLSPHTVTDSFVIAGCDLGLGLLSGHLQYSAAASKGNVLWIGVDNSQALRQLSNGMVHVAAVHFPSDMTAQQSPYTDIARIQFSDWEVGWIVRRGNPLGFRSVDHLRSGKIRIVNRPIGSGVRALLDGLVKEHGLAPSLIPQYDWAVAGHRQVAEAIATGMADVGIGTATAASMLHLDFIPIRKESCELFIPRSRLKTTEVQKLLDTLNSDVFRWELERFGPCDIRGMGQEVGV